MKPARLLQILPPVLLAVATTVWLVSNAKPPARVAETEKTVTARTLTVTPQEIRLVAKGYGVARPAWSWQAVAEVAGAIVFRHPELETGNILPAGLNVLEIDPAPYQIALRQAEADRDALKVEQDQLEVDRTNTNRLLEIERERLSLSKRDLERTQVLVARGNASQSRLDEMQRSNLQLQRGVRELENALALIPVRAAGLAAQIARSEAALDRAKRDLSLTRIVTPQDIRVGTVHVERHQFTQPGKLLVTGDSVDRAEVTAQIPIDAFSRLMGGVSQSIDLSQGGPTATFKQLDADLRLVSAQDQHWTGTVLRIENALDPDTRSVPVVIAVDHPYEGAAPPQRLPLVPNMYVEVTLSAPAPQPRIVLPAKAVHDGRVYLRDTDGRLALREITPAWQQGDQIVIKDGLSPGEEVILDDILPALPGLRVLPAGPAQ